MSDPSESGAAHPNDVGSSSADAAAPERTAGDPTAGTPDPAIGSDTSPEVATTGTADEASRGWDRRLFPTDDFQDVVRRALGLSLGLYALGFVLALAWGLDWAYLDPSTFLGISAALGTVGVFLELLILGRWSVATRHVWADAESAIASDQRQRYRHLVADHVDRATGIRFDRLVDAKLVVLAFVLVEPPFALSVNGLNPLLPWDFLLIYYNAALVLLGLTGWFVFALHVHLVAAVARLDLETPFSAARSFEPVAHLGISVAVYWFLGVTVLGIYYWLDFLEGLLQSGDLPTVATSLPYSLAVHSALMVVLVLVGTLIFLGPPWLIHRAIGRARRSLVHDVNERRDQRLQGWTADSDGWTDLSADLDSLESVHHSANRIPTWPFHVPDLVKVGLSALLPVGQILLSLFV